MFSALKSDLLGRIQNSVALLTLVRGAHKKAGGSKTYMQDSPGKRLGPKKHEGEKVSVGQIIMRQRGTKWYPGSNVGIGKDHTLFAMEPGYVRYYLDPFHPKRKFIGIALGKDERLPYEHFDATHRRLGRTVLENPVAAKREEEYMSRKESLALPEILKEKGIRDQRRAAKIALLAKRLPEFIPELDDESVSLAAERLGAIDGFLRGGKSLEDARFYATYNYNYDLKLRLDATKEVTPEISEELKKKYAELVNIVDSRVMFDAKFNLCKNLTDEEREQKKQENVAALKELIPDANIPVDKKVKIQAWGLIEDTCFSLSERLHLKRRFLKPVLPESAELLGDEKTKNTVAISRMNYDTRRVETVYRLKKGFLGQRVN
ncbi:DEKNAAC103472 [Brettanomyces naardenensis]|uniref:Large ribosomal subunit protein bL27m n=1 Tax=Brettanomyces naardenensis TaxID=13370 RepID=A0A448YN13_BRENA|nr:DEKNAAC103472 [Brettanomyces naardenensis]